MSVEWDTDGSIADVTDVAGWFAEGTFPAAAQRVLVMHPDDQTGRMLHPPGLKTAGTCPI